MKPSVTDLFKTVPVTRADVYAWLLAVTGLDPQSPRAAEYVRTFDVVGKIAQAKLAGSFECQTESAAAGARYRELIAADIAGAPALALLALPAAPAPRPMRLTAKARAPRRSKEEIARARRTARQQKWARAEIRAGALNRLPGRLPNFEELRDALGQPSAHAIGEALQVHATTVRRWIREGRAPRAAMLALFWLTRWGVSEVDAKAHNDAVTAVARARSGQEALDALRLKTQRLWQLADFGSANDPASEVVPAVRSGAHTEESGSRTPIILTAAPGQGGIRRPRRTPVKKAA